MALKPAPIVFHMLARAYHRTGDKDNALRVVRAGRKWYADDKQLKIDYAAQLIRLGQEADKQEAETIPRSLQLNVPGDGRVLQQLCKLLCGEGRVEEAEAAIRGQDIYPERYRIPISVEIAIGRKRFEEALSILRDTATGDEHLIGLTRKVYLRWARVVEHTDPAEAREIAIDGLRGDLGPALRNNIPIMVTSARLAAIAGDDRAFGELVSEIERLNPGVSAMLRDEEEGIAYWEEDLFEGAG